MLLVLQQVWFDRYRVIQSAQDRAWVEGNGHSLVKTHNAGLTLWLAVPTKTKLVDVQVHQPVQSVCISISVRICIKAQCEGNGNSLVKHCNAETDHHRDARRVALSVSLPLLHFL